MHVVIKTQTFKVLSKGACYVGLVVYVLCNFFSFRLFFFEFLGLFERDSMHMHEPYGEGQGGGRGREQRKREGQIPP